MTAPYCRLIVPTELTPCLRWALPAYSPERAAWIVERLTACVNSGQVSQIVAAAATPRPLEPLAPQELIAVAIAMPQAAGAATLVVLHSDEPNASDVEIEITGKARAATAPSSSQSPCELARCVLGPVVSRLREQGVKFLQAACDGPEQAERLGDGGFQHLADLSLMSLPAKAYAAAKNATGSIRAPAAKPAKGRPQARWVTLEALGPDWPECFCSVAARTFAQTLDCPRLNDFRTAEEMVRGFMESPTFDPSLSRLLRLGEQWAGCLILTAHQPPELPSPATGTPHGGTLELAYMGLVPACRRQGHSNTLLAETVAVAQQRAASQVVLAVDQANHPAMSNYRRCGWRQLAAESVWGLRVLP